MGSDSRAIARLYRELVDDESVSVDSAQVEALRQSPSSFLLVCLAGDEVCGTVLLSICADAMYAGQPFGVVENLVVSRNASKQGFGSALVQEVDRISLLTDCTKILLSSSRSREDSHRFFRAHGYSDEGKVGVVKYRRQLASTAEQGTGRRDLPPSATETQ